MVILVTIYLMADLVMTLICRQDQVYLYGEEGKDRLESSGTYQILFMENLTLNVLIWYLEDQIFINGRRW